MINSKKIFIAGIISLIISVFALTPMSIKAMDSSISGDLVLGSENVSEGYSLGLARGAYLQSGLSRISDAGNGKVTVTGITFAQRRVEEITVSVELQRMVGGSWKTYKMWTKTAKDDISVEFVETLEVDPGTYRVISLHSANGDASSSFTNGLYIS